jgi:ribonuclease HI
MTQDKTFGKITEHKALLLCVDGGCEPKNPGGIATYGWVIYGKNKQILVEDCNVVLDGGPLATNNYAEYCALGFALKWLREQKWRGNLTVQGDSQLLIYQVTEKWKCKAKHLQPLRERIWQYLDDLKLDRNACESTFTCLSCDQKGDINTLIDFEDDGLLCPMCHTTSIVLDSTNPSVNFVWVPREENSYADELSNRAYRGYVKQKKERSM